MMLGLKYSTKLLEAAVVSSLGLVAGPLSRRGQCGTPLSISESPLSADQRRSLITASYSLVSLGALESRGLDF